MTNPMSNPIHGNPSFDFFEHMHEQSITKYNFALYYALHYVLLYTVQYAIHFALHYILHYALQYALHSTLHYSLHNQCIISNC